MLTREEAAARSRALAVASYDLHVDLRDPQAFRSVTEVRFRTSEPGGSTFLELDAEVVSLVRCGVAAEPEREGRRLLLRDLAPEEVVRVEATGPYGSTGEGLHRSTDPADGRDYVYTQSFLDDAPRFLACFDQPDLKAPVRLTVDAPADWEVLSTTRAEVTHLDDGRRHAFAPTPPLPTYLVCFAAGPWHGVSRQHGGIELSVWCRQSAAAHLDADEVLDVTGRSLDLLAELFGHPYPFGDAYRQVLCPDFVGGAMENPAVVTLNEDRYLFRSRVTQGQRRDRATTIAHEAAHMWFGDLVTMRWWDDLWLSEAFAELLGTLVCDRALPFAGSWESFGLSRKAWGLQADQRPTTHPVADAVPDTAAALMNFDGISYAKGAAVLRQLMAWTGEEAFFAGLRDYVARHAWGSAELPDLLGAIERSCGRDLSAWAEAWLRSSGVSTLRVADGAVLQTGSVLRPHRTAVGLYDEVGGALRLRERLVVDVDGARTALPALAPAALVLPDSGDLGFAALRLDAGSVAALQRGLGTMDDPLDRVVAWGALWDTCRSAELPAEEWVDTVVAHVAAEHDPALVGQLLSQALTAATLFSDDPDLRADLAEELARLLPVQEAGSDLQLVVARAAASAAVDPSMVVAWLDGSGLPAGLVVDADLRWHLLAAAAGLDGVDAARIAAEADADRTDSGLLGAARASAALSDPDAKEAAWAALLEDPSLSVARARALGAGFWQAGQDLGAWVPRYLAEVPAVAAQRSTGVGTALLGQAFPRTEVRQEVLDAADALLATELPAALRRTLLEARYDLALAVAARAASV